jgi:hypothetical protein
MKKGLIKLKKLMIKVFGVMELMTFIINSGHVSLISLVLFLLSCLANNASNKGPIIMAPLISYAMTISGAIAMGSFLVYSGVEF